MAGDRNGSPLYANAQLGPGHRRYEQPATLLRPPLQLIVASLPRERQRLFLCEDQHTGKAFVRQHNGICYSIQISSSLIVIGPFFCSYSIFWCECLLHSHTWIFMSMNQIFQMIMCLHYYSFCIIYPMELLKVEHNVEDVIWVEKYLKDIALRWSFNIM